MSTDRANPLNSFAAHRLPSPKTAIRFSIWSWLAMVTLLWLSGITQGQVSLTTRAPAAEPQDKSHAQRCLAAIDLAVVAAESGIVDVSMEAMRRATRKGPPVASMELGGLLSTKPNARSRQVTSGNAANLEAASAQAKLAGRLHHLHQIWIKQQVDPAQAYEAFKSLVLPASRPNEVFTYSVAIPNRQAISYSSFDFDLEQPKLADCGVSALVEWARLAGKNDDLLAEIQRRENVPAASSVILLVKVLLAQDESRPAAEASELCEKLSTQAKLLVNGPDAELLFGHVWKMLDRVAPDAPERQKLTGAILDAMGSDQNWAANQWLLFLVAQGLRDSLDRGDEPQFRRYADVAISRYEPIRSSNADYIASQEAALYGAAARRAFAAGHLKLAAGCLRRQSQLPVSQTYLQSQADVILDPLQPVAQALLAMDRSERYELLKSLVWIMPELGLSRSARMNVTDSIPPVFLTSAPQGAAVPWREVAGANARSVSLLEWMMRDAIALGKQADVDNEIAKIEAKGSDDAKLARLVFGLAQDKPADLSLLTKTAADGSRSLVPAMGENGRVTPLDIEIVEQALAQEEYRAMGLKLLDQLLAMAITQHQDLFVTLTRDMKFRLRTAEPAATQLDLVHWVSADDLTQSNFASGHVPHSLWIKRDEKTWGHQFGTDFSTLLFRYPLAGKYSISFRTLDGTYIEGSATLSGRMIEFLEYRSKLQVWGIGLRNMAQLPTDALKNDEFNAIRLDRNANALTINVGDDFQKELNVPAGDFPFFGLCAYHYRESSIESLKIDGDVTIPRSVEMLSPGLIGWTARFKDQKLPDVAVLSEGDSTADDDPEIDDDWRFQDGVLESVNREATSKKAAKPGKPIKRDKYVRPRREGLVQYLRPLCAGEQISLEFYHEPGKYSLAPALGRIALLLSDGKVSLHWITADPAGTTTGIDETNRIVDEQAEQPGPISLKENDWNQLSLRLEDNVAILSINGQMAYRRVWEPEAGRAFGLFHDPTQFHVRARSIQLSGDWPEKLPTDLFELKPKQKLTSAR